MLSSRTKLRRGPYLLCQCTVKYSITQSKDSVMKPAQEKIENIDQRLRIQPLRGGNLLYIT